MLQFLWTLLKLFLSCVILGLAGLLLFHNVENILDAPETLFITAVFFLAVLPWQTARSAIGARGTALMPLCMSECFLLAASNSYHGKIIFRTNAMADERPRATSSTGFTTQWESARQ
jgi:hypothetical protein